MIFLFILWVAGAQAADKEPRPALEWDHTQGNLGMLVQGATVQHDFPVRNRSKNPVRILSVQASCGCTAVTPESKVIGPRQKSVIHVKYDSRGMMGSVYKTVRIETDDKAGPVQYLVLRGEVIPSGHPDMTGSKNLFEGSCATCHEEPGIGKTGAALYQADCAMCHELVRPHGPQLAPRASDMAGLPASALGRMIRDGVEGTSMPAFHADRGGPLSDAQIDSLVEYIRSLRGRSR